ncbi:MAG: M48 family metalloprotease [Nitrospirae bacterium]|nr:M48 family metalloprotease [Nitrospirota bacterium]
MSKDFQMKSYLLIFSAILLFGCAVYTPVKKTENTTPSKEMGKSFVSEALQHYQFIKDPEVVNMVNRAGYRIVRAIGSNPESYHFLVVHEAQPNAFAIPGGYIFVFDGLLLQLKGEDEIAGVLAHEIAHIERNHFFKDAKKVAALDIATIAAILLGGGGIAATTIASAANIDVRLQFSRENESEADSYGLRYLQTAGYPPGGLLDFFDNLLRYERFNPQSVPAYMSTHPDLASRRDIVANFVSREAMQASPDLLKKTIEPDRVGWGRVQAVLISYDQKRKEESSILQALGIDEMPAEAREEVKDYLLGVTYMKEGRFNEAISKYLSAIERNRENPVYYADLAFSYLKLQDLSRAREAALQSLRLKADHAPAHVILGILDQDSGNLSEAINHLEEALRTEPEDLTTNFHLAMAYRKSGDTVREAFYSARYLRINLNPEGALGELNRAKGLAAENNPLYFRISEEIQEIRREGL